MKQAYSAAAQPVVDVTNLIQNIQQTLRTLHIENQTLIANAQRAKEIGQSAQMLINMENQLMMAKRNLENMKIMIETGKYKSINELNALCFQIQRIGYNVENINTSYDQLFQDKYLSKALSVAGLKKQEEEMKEVVKGALITEAEAIKRNNENAANINTLMYKAQDAVGIKGAVQVNAALLAELASQNMEIKKLLAMISRLNAMDLAKQVAKDERERDDAARFIIGDGEGMEKKGIMTETLERFTTAISFGYTAMVPQALDLLRYFIVLEIFFFGIMVMYTRVSVPHETVKKLLAIGFYIWLIPNIGIISGQISKTFAHAGVFAGGNALTANELFDPSAICTKGLDIAMPLFSLATTTGGIVGWVSIFLTALVVLCCYLYISWVLFMTAIEYTLVTVAAVFLMPFSLFKPLQFIAERTISAAFSIGIRFMILGITFCGTKLVIDTMVTDFKAIVAAQVGEKGLAEALLSGAFSLSISQSMDLILVAITIAVIFYSATRISSVYFGGDSVLSASFYGAVKSSAKKAASLAAKTNIQDSIINKIKKATSYA